MSDGSSFGITAGRALDTIISGDPPPTDAERRTPDQVRIRLEAQPLFEGTALYGRSDTTSAYSDGADMIGHAFLVLMEEKPGKAWTLDSCWNAMTKRWPAANRYVGGATGFMVGFAFNAARYVLSEPLAANPAIIEIELGPEYPPMPDIPQVPHHDGPEDHPF